jgi:hypothetical protein
LTKSRIAVALSGASILQTNFAKLRECIEPLPRQARHLSAGRFRLWYEPFHHQAILTRQPAAVGFDSGGHFLVRYAA